MKPKKFKSVKDTTISFVEFVKIFSTEYKVRKYLINLRWGNQIVCPHCGHKVIYSCNRKDGSGFFECQKCKKVFSIRTGTIFERSHVPLRKWLYACYKIITARKGISSVQLAVEIGVTQKTAWFMLQRIRKSCSETIDVNKMLKNIVEADASYFGGREKSKHASKKHNMGRGTIGKVAVLGAKERGGRVGAVVLKDTSSETVHSELSKMIDKTATLMTDEHGAYLNAPFASHKIVRHAVKEFVNDMASTNEIESVWSILKRGWIGIYHHFSAKHIQLYVNEFCFRLNDAKCDMKLEDRLRNLCGFGLKSSHLTFKNLLAKKGDNGLMRAA